MRSSHASKSSTLDRRVTGSRSRRAPASFSAVPDPDPELLDLLDEMRARDECASSKIYQAIVFATAIRLVMRQCHMSASDLARKLAVDRSALYHWFNKKAFPSNLPELWQRLGQLYWRMT